MVCAALAYSQNNVVQRPKCRGVIHGTVFDLRGQPVKGVHVTAWPLGVGLGAMLPTLRTDQSGEYRFEHVCPGRYAVIADDEAVAYRSASPMTNEFLYGSPVEEVRINANHARAELPVYLPPRPGFMVVRIIDEDTKQEVQKCTVTLEVPGQHGEPELSSMFESAEQNHVIEVPPDKDVVVHITADGFHEWSESIGAGKVVHVQSGERATLEAELDRLK
jgi:carboxypeptidase family protein